MMRLPKFVDGFVSVGDCKFAVRAEILGLLEDAGGFLVRWGREATAMPSLSSTDDCIWLAIVSGCLLTDDLLASRTDFIVRNGLDLWCDQFNLETGTVELLAPRYNHIGFFVIPSRFLTDNLSTLFADLIVRDVQDLGSSNFEIETGTVVLLAPRYNYVWCDIIGAFGDWFTTSRAILHI